MKIAIMQPTFNPWLGYFDLIDYVDKFIFLDTVQLSRRSWQVRNKLKINDREYMFTLPLVKEVNRDFEIINKTRLLDKEKNKRKLFNLLQENYKKSLYFNEVNDFVKELVFYDTEYLSCYNINIISKICKKLDIDTELITLSETKYYSKEKKGKYILNICQYFNATEYISPLGSKGYLDADIANFNINNIQVLYQDYNHPEYTQLGSLFIPYIGIFDLIYNEGYKRSKEIILSGRKYRRCKYENR